MGFFIREPYWFGTGSHRIDLREDTHDSWMDGLLERGSSRREEDRCHWKEETFLEGNTYDNDQVLDDLWYIVADWGEVWELFEPC